MEFAFQNVIPMSEVGPAACAGCAVVLSHPRRGQRFCSPRCRLAAWRERVRTVADARTEREVRALLETALRRLEEPC